MMNVFANQVILLLPYSKALPYLTGMFAVYQNHQGLGQTPPFIKVNLPAVPGCHLPLCYTPCVYYCNQCLHSRELMGLCLPHPGNSPGVCTL